MIDGDMDARRLELRHGGRADPRHPDREGADRPHHGHARKLVESDEVSFIFGQLGTPGNSATANISRGRAFRRSRSSAAPANSPTSPNIR
jgi:hypothetical protein